MTSVWSESAGFVPAVESEEYDASSPFRQEFRAESGSADGGSSYGESSYGGSTEASSLWGESFADSAVSEPGFGESGFGESALAEAAFLAVPPSPLADVNTLTNVVFFARHPERQGRGLSSAEPGYRALGDEWTTIRDTVVALGALTARAGAGQLRGEGARHEPFEAGRDDEAPTSYIETALVRSAIAAGRTDENTLCDMIFFKRHPERNGRLISRSEPDYGRLSSEWLTIRDALVRPILRGAPATPAPVPGPWPPSPWPGRPVPGGPTPGGPLPTKDRAALLAKVKGYIASKQITFTEGDEVAGISNGTGVVRREDGTTTSINTQVLRAYVLLVERGFTFNVSAAIAGHKKLTSTGGVSPHWDGRAFDANVINGKGINDDGEAAKPDTMRFMLALNDLRSTDLAPRQVICSGNGREDPDVLKLQFGVTCSKPPPCVVPDHDDHVHVGY
jgi:hypothetical protein